jgi:hypothetical protein
MKSCFILSRTLLEGMEPHAAAVNFDGVRSKRANKNTCGKLFGQLVWWMSNRYQFPQKVLDISRIAKVVESLCSEIHPARKHRLTNIVTFFRQSSSNLSIFHREKR